MNNKDTIRQILKEPSYWIEGINTLLYDAILTYMEKEKLNRSQLAKHLNISKSRVSQILNDGEINFSISKVIEIALKINMFPTFKLIGQEEYLSKNIEYYETTSISNNFFNLESEVTEDNLIIQTFNIKSQGLILTTH